MADIEKQVQTLIEAIEKVQYICNNVKFDYIESGYAYFTAVDIANCDLSVRIEMDNSSTNKHVVIFEDYGDGWEVVEDEYIRN